jgi:PadR family transcriptional regulator, regulatory protein PadR
VDDAAHLFAAVDLKPASSSGQDFDACEKTTDTTDTVVPNRVFGVSNLSSVATISPSIDLAPRLLLQCKRNAMIGEFEYLLISAAANLGEDAYGAAIREQIEATTDRRCSMGALYTTIDRLEKKGLLKTWMGPATSERGGRAKRMVQVTAKGVQAAKEFYDAVIRVSRGASWAAQRAGKSS